MRRPEALEGQAKLLFHYRRLTDAIISVRQADDEAFQLGNDDVDPLLADYHTELDDLLQQAIAGDIDRDEFEERLDDLVAATLLLMFVTGSGDSDIPLEAQLAFESEIQTHREAASRLADDIYVDEVFTVTEDLSEEAAEIRRLSRIALWVAGAAGLYALGQAHGPDDRRLVWRWDPDKEHCDTCRALNDQVATVADWRASGYRPQGRMLVCGGWLCGCGWFETQADLTGPIVV